MSQKTIAVISGGMDSVTMLYKLKAEGKKLKAISFNYGQRHKRELEMARATCEKLGIQHDIVDITSITSFISNSALTGDIEVPHGNYADENMKKTVVPSRNTIMASIANGYAINSNFDSIALAVHAGDHAIYPDCRPEFITALQTLFCVNNFEAIDIITPYLYKTKIDIVTEGIELNVDYTLTHTCYEGGEKPCGKCGSCVERTEAFYKNNTKDPLYDDAAWETAVSYMKEKLEYAE